MIQKIYTLTITDYEEHNSLVGMNSFLLRTHRKIHFTFSFLEYVIFSSIIFLTDGMALLRNVPGGYRPMA